MSSRLKATGIAAGAALAGGLVVGLKASIDAAMDAQKVLGQTRVAVRNAGQSFDLFQAQIEASTKALSNMAAVDDEELLRSFSVLVRATGDVNRALELNQTAADLARARNMDLVSAAQLLARVSMGQYGSRRRLGIQIDKNATSYQALDQIQRKYAGAAAAYGRTAAGAQERFNVALQNMGEAIGTALLPSVTDYLNKASAWLNNSENQARITRDMESAVRVLDGTVQAATPGVEALATSFGNLAGAIELATQASDRFHLPDIPGVGTVSKIAMTPGMAPIIAGKTIYDVLFGGGGGASQAPAWARDYDLIERVRGGGRYAAGKTAPAAPAGAKGPRGVTAEQRNRWFDSMISRMLDRTQDIPTLKGQIGRLRQIAGLVQQRIAATKDVTRRLTLEDTLAGVMRQIRSNQQQIADDTRAAADAARQRQQELARLAKERKLGWLEFAAERAEATKTVRDDVRAQRAILRYWQARLRHEGRTLEIVSNIWRTRQRINELNKKNADSDPLAGLRQVSSRQMAAMLAAGTGLGARGRGILAANVAGLEMRPMYVGVNIDGREVGRAVTRDQSRTGQRTARQTSGYRG